MRRMAGGLRLAAVVVWALLGAGIGGVANNKLLAGVSVVAAFGIWFVVQDVENPRAEATIPAPDSQPIAVRAVNVPAGYIVDTQPVRVRVRARETTLEDLRQGDFEATIDLQGIDPAEPGRNLPVSVRSLRGDVRVLAAEPASIPITLVEAGSAEKAVTLEVRGQLLESLGYAPNSPALEPRTVTFRGRKDLVDAVDRVVAVVDVGPIRASGEHVRDVELVALNRDGNPQTVTIDPPRTRVTLDVVDIVATRQVRLKVQYSGFPAPGYEVKSAVAEPESVTISGPKPLVDARDEMLVSPVEITGAKSDITQTRPVITVEDIAGSQRTVVVRVTIGLIDCSSAQAACNRATYLAAPIFLDRPTGLVTARIVSVPVRVIGPEASLAAFRPADHARVTISLAGVTPGTRTFTPVLALLPNAPAGLRIEPVEDVIITFEAVPIP